jgi:hypothetical protein
VAHLGPDQLDLSIAGHGLTHGVHVDLDSHVCQVEKQPVWYPQECFCTWFLGHREVGGTAELVPPGCVGDRPREGRGRNGAHVPFTPHHVLGSCTSVELCYLSAAQLAKPF